MKPEDKLDQWMKEKYQEIKIPLDLEEDIFEKLEKKNDKSKVQYLKYVAIILFICAIIATTVIIVNIVKNHDNPEELIAEENEEYQVALKIDQACYDKMDGYSYFVSSSSIAQAVESADIIAIVKIVTIEDIQMYSESLGETRGKLLINTVLKGDAIPGDMMVYRNIGSYIILKEEYRDRIITDISQDIYSRMENQSQNDVEPGKTYLAHIRFEHGVGTTGYGKGSLMEILNISQQNKMSVEEYDLNELIFYNHELQQTQTVQEYIEEYLK